MLVLRRKSGERIIIGTDIVVTVVSVQGSRVKLAFDAPHEVPIAREDVRLAQLSQAESSFDLSRMAGRS
jgi:carbon storage regulator